MKIVEILLEKKTRNKTRKSRKIRVRNMYANTSFATPVGGFGGWYYGVPMDVGASDSSGGDGGGGGGE